MKSFVKTSVVWAALLAVVPAAFAEKPVPVAGSAAKDQVTQDLLDKVKQQLKDAPVVRGKFEQEKSIKGFKQPLRSSGEFVVAKNKGIVWHVLKPFESTLIVKPDSLQSRRGDGEVSMQMRAEDEPVLRTVNAMLFAVMSADLVQLRQFFEVSGKAQASGWQMHLVPRDPMLAQWLASVDLQGGAFVREVKLQEARGDSSVIRIQDATAEQARITHAAQAQIEAERQSAAVSLRKDVGSLAIDLASGVVGVTLADDQKASALVDRFLAELEASEKAAQ